MPPQRRAKPVALRIYGNGKLAVISLHDFFTVKAISCMNPDIYLIRSAVTFLYIAITNGIIAVI